MGISVKPETPKPPHILSGDEWEQAQYAPHRLGQDPTTPMPGGRILTGDEWEQASSAASFRSLTFPAMPKFAADATSRLNPNAGPADRSVPEQMGAGVRNVAAGFDLAAQGLDPVTAASARVVAALGRQAVAPAVEHPLLTAALANPVGAVVGTGLAVKTIAQYGWQKAHEAMMSSEDRARSEADPNRVSGEAAAVQAVMLGLGTLAGVHAVAKAADVSQGVVEAGMQGVRLESTFENNRPLLRLPQGAEVLGATAAAHGLPETASPYPPDSPLDAAWKTGHASATPEVAQPSRAEPTAQTAPAQAAPTEPTVTPSPEPVAGGPSYKNPAGLYKRLSNDALGAEYRSLIEKRTAEQPNAEAPLWTPEREAEAVSQIENRRRPDGSLAAADKRQLDALQAAQGEDYYVGRHTPESAAAERRVTDMTKHITAIETEFQNRGLNPADAMQVPSVGGEGTLPPVEGTGDVKTRGLALGVEQKAIAKELTDYLGDLPEYRTVNMAEQADHATRLIDENPDLARRVALGEVDAPHGLLPESVFVAVENKAIAEGDVATIRDLASGKLTEQATTMGQRIRALGERNPDSPVAAIQRITEARGKAQTPESIADAIAELKTHIEEATKVAPDAWEQFINSIRC
jgi:hypothetical protein